MISSSGCVLPPLREKKGLLDLPVVEESDVSDLMSAEERHAVLTKALGQRIGLVHGRMTAAEKDEAMALFKSGQTRLLVATTVIEVGVDVPDATIMVIEHAERFGLAQLHQLRGRVGRGDEASTCLLLYKGPLSENGRARLNIMRETEDGFLIAEEDLKLRGEGELLGTRQSGTPGFIWLALRPMAICSRWRARMLPTSSHEGPEPRRRTRRPHSGMLYFHRRDEAIRFLRAG